MKDVILAAPALLTDDQMGEVSGGVSGMATVKNASLTWNVVGATTSVFYEPIGTMGVHFVVSASA